MAFLSALGRSQAVSGSLRDFMALRDQRMQEDQQALQMRREAIATQAAEEAYATKKRQDDMLLPIDTVLPGLAQKMPGFYGYLMDWGKKQGFVQDVGGVPVVRQGDMQSIMKVMADDIAFNKVGTEKMLQDVLGQEMMLTQQIAQSKNPKERAAMQEQLRMVRAQITSIVNALNQADEKYRLAEMQQAYATKRSQLSHPGRGRAGFTGYTTDAYGNELFVDKGKPILRLGRDGQWVKIGTEPREGRGADEAEYGKKLSESFGVDMTAQQRALGVYGAALNAGKSVEEAYRAGLTAGTTAPTETVKAAPEGPGFFGKVGAAMSGAAGAVGNFLGWGGEGGGGGGQILPRSEDFQIDWGNPNKYAPNEPALPGYSPPAVTGDYDPNEFVNKFGFSNIR